MERWAKAVSFFAQHFGVEYGHIVVDHAAFFQFFDALENGGSGEVEVGGEFFDGYAAVLLEAAEDLEVCFVEFYHNK